MFLEDVFKGWASMNAVRMCADCTSRIGSHFWGLANKCRMDATCSHMLRWSRWICIYIYIYLAYVHGYHEETVSLVTFLYNLTGCGICIIDCDLRWFVIPKSSLASMPFPPRHLSMQGTHWRFWSGTCSADTLQYCPGVVGSLSWEGRL